MVRHTSLGSGGFMFKSERWEWDDVTDDPRKHLPQHNDMPITNLRVTYTDTEECRDRSYCFPILRRIKEEDKSLGLNDIRYNFLIGSDGTVYEGRGWLFQPNCPNREPKYGTTIDVAFIGDYADGHMTYNMLAALMNLVKYGLKTNMISSSYGIGYFRPDTTEFDSGDKLTSGTSLPGAPGIFHVRNVSYEDIEAEIKLGHSQLSDNIDDSNEPQQVSSPVDDPEIASIIEDID